MARMRTHPSMRPAREKICWSAVSAAGPADLAQLAGLAELAADGEDIREATAEAPLQPAGPPCWWRAVNDWPGACPDRAERGLLPRLRPPRDPALRHQLGRLAGRGPGPLSCQPRALTPHPRPASRPARHRLGFWPVRVT